MTEAPDGSVVVTASAHARFGLEIERSAGDQAQLPGDDFETRIGYRIRVCVGRIRIDDGERADRRTRRIFGTWFGASVMPVGGLLPDAGSVVTVWLALTDWAAPATRYVAVAVLVIDVFGGMATAAAAHRPQTSARICRPKNAAGAWCLHTTRQTRVVIRGVIRRCAELHRIRRNAPA